ncbi:hypothetical protein HID58_013103 [Brassica napus]|uniref:Uncharacterized protein n=1 Tax=Brassica napus TaxID=3708 RepID=A0ABQ8E2Z9_BRANA|nr:hypothetical protein HID58_013103 [Brassica napus]
MDLETENRIASVLLREAAELRRQAEKDGVRAYLEKPNVRHRPNSRFLTATVLGVKQYWYSTYVSSRVTGSPNRPHVVFIDGHCTTQLEESWTGLFSGIRYATNFTKPLCFRHTILSPLGYETALFNGLSGEIDCNGESAHSLWLDPDNTKTARLSEVVSLLKCLC